MASQDENIAAQNLAAAHYAHRNDPQNIISRLRASLPQGTTTQGSFKDGGVVPKTGAYTLHAGEQVTPAPDSQSQQDAPAASAQSNLPAAPQTPASDDEVPGGTLNLQKAYSKLNSSVTKLFDELGVRRSATWAHIDGQSMADHMNGVGKTLPDIGGAMNNLLTATHTQHDPNGGETVAHPTEKLRTMRVPQDFEPAKAAIAAGKSLVSKIESLVGETPEVKTAKAQLQLISKAGGSGMTAYDLGAALISIPGPLIQSLSRAHSEVKHGRVHPLLTAPKAQVSQEEQQ